VSKDLWRTLIDAAEADQAVQIELSPGERIHRPKRPTRGRPPVLRVAAFSHYQGYNPEIQRRPRCACRGCRRWLRKGQAVGCSPEHERAAVEAAREILSRHDPASLPPVELADGPGPRLRIHAQHGSIVLTFDDLTNVVEAAEKHGWKRGAGK
jgi:hypothetical protein